MTTPTPARRRSLRSVWLLVGFTLGAILMYVPDAFTPQTVIAVVVGLAIAAHARRLDRRDRGDSS